MKSEKRAGTDDQANGFSLLEMVVVLVLLVVLGGVMMAGRETSASVVAEGRIFRSHLGFMQSLALANNTASWSVLLAPGAYTLRRDGVASPVPWPGADSVTHTLPAEVRIIQGLGVLTLNQYGAPSNTHHVVLSDGSHQERISILAFTGLVQ